MAIRGEDVLAGPLVRRVTTDSVAVWTVLAAPATVTLQIWREPEGSAGGELAGTATSDTVRVGERLCFGLSIVRFSTGSQLEPGRVYAYDLLFDGRSLGDLGLLRNGTIGGHRHLALGYIEGLLPTFVVPPRTAAELVLSHGSCRRPYAAGKDGLVALDQIIERGRIPSAQHRRPHIMFHTGDQVYADDTTPELLEWMSDAGVELIGRNVNGQPIERVRVDLPSGNPEEGHRATVEFPVDKLHFPPARRQRLLARAAGLTSNDGESHTIGVGEYIAHYLFSWCNVLWPHLDDETPDGDWRRLHRERGALVREFLGAWLERYREMSLFAMSGRDARGSLETRLKYLDAWRLLPTSFRAIDQLGRRADDEDADWAGSDDPRWMDFWSQTAGGAPKPPSSLQVGATSGVPRTRLVGADPDLQDLLALTTPPWYAGAHHTRIDLTYLLERDPPAESVDQIFIRTDQVLSHLRQLRRFYEGLPHVRRALANVSSLMMFDDHEISDDWNITRNWIHRVYARALGRDLVSNGLTAYALCQDWGNAPERYEEGGTNRVILEAAQTMFRQSAEGPARTHGPETGTDSARSQLERAFGLDAVDDLLQQAVWDWRTTPSDVSGYEILAVDNRTRRGFDTRHASPANLTDDALSQQIPASPPAGSELTIVVAPLPPLGFPPLEQIGQPYLNLLHDHTKNPEHLEVVKRSNFPNLARDYMFGRLIKDPEPWGFHAHALEELFRRLSTRRSVIFLSGDVHYSLTGKMTYWKAEPVLPGSRSRLAPATRFVQLTSSALQNETGAHEILLAHLGLAQQFGAVVTGTYDRLGWRSAGVDGPSLPSSEPLSPQLRRNLQQEPVIVPTRMLPADVRAALRAGTLPVPPEWAWRLEQVKDLRPDSVRYEALATSGTQWRLPDEAELTADGSAAFRKISNHHNWHVRSGSPRRFLMYSSVCTVHFEIDASSGHTIYAVHSMYSWDRGGAGPGGGPIGAGPWPTALLSAQPYTVHRIPMDPSDEIPPDQEQP